MEDPKSKPDMSEKKEAILDPEIFKQYFDDAKTNKTESEEPTKEKKNNDHMELKSFVETKLAVIDELVNLHINKLQLKRKLFHSIQLKTVC